jgi:hypothetical protein
MTTASPPRAALTEVQSNTVRVPAQQHILQCAALC